MLVTNIYTGYDKINPIKPGSRYVVINCKLGRDVTLGKTKLQVSMIQEELAIAYFNYDAYFNDLYTYVTVYGSNLVECFGYLQRELAGVTILNVDKLVNFLENPKITNRTIVTLVDGRCAILGDGNPDKRESIKKVRPKATERITELRLPYDERLKKLGKRLSLVGGADDISTDYGIVLNLDRAGGIKNNSYLRMCDYLVCTNTLYKAKFDINDDTNITLKAMHRLEFRNISSKRVKIYIDRACIVRDCLFEGMDVYIKNANVVMDNQFTDCNVYMQDCLYAGFNKHNNTNASGSIVYNNIGELNAQMLDDALDVKVSKAKSYNIQIYSGRLQMYGKLDPKTKIFVGENPGGVISYLEDPLVVKRANNSCVRLMNG